MALDMGSCHGVLFGSVCLSEGDLMSPVLKMQFALVSYWEVQ